MREEKEVAERGLTSREGHHTTDPAKEVVGSTRSNEEGKRATGFWTELAMDDGCFLFALPMSEILHGRVEEPTAVEEVVKLIQKRHEYLRKGTRKEGDEVRTVYCIEYYVVVWWRRRS